MATYSQTRAVGNVTDDATFRVWGEFLSDSMESAGWTKTADTGQIDWATVTKPTGANTVGGYEIRKSPTQTGYTDFYLKLEYGVGGNVIYSAMWQTIGTGTDGAGTLTGTVSTRYQSTSGANAGQVEDLVCGSTDWLVFLWSSTTGATRNAVGAFMAFERFTDADGNYATNGIVTQRHGAGTSGTFSMTSAAAYTNTALNALGYMPPSYAGSAGTVFVAPAMPNRPDAQYPMRVLCFIGESNTGIGQTHSFAMFPGQTQTWRGNQQSIVTGDLSITSPEEVCPVIRWE